MEGNSEVTLKRLQEQYQSMLGDPIPVQILTQANATIGSNFMELDIFEFRGKDKVRIKIRQPNIQEEAYLGRLFAEEFNKIVQDENSTLKTKDQLKAIYEKKGIWTSDNDKEIENMTEDLRNLGLEAGNIRIYGDEKIPANQHRLNKIRQEFKELQNKIADRNSTRYALFNQSIEGIVDDMVVRQKVVMLTSFSDGGPIWNNVVELEQDTERNGIIQILSSAISFWSGLAQDIIQRLPGKLSQGGNNQEVSTNSPVEKQNDGSSSISPTDVSRQPEKLDP